MRGPADEAGLGQRRVAGGRQPVQPGGEQRRSHRMAQKKSGMAMNTSCASVATRSMAGRDASPHARRTRCRGRRPARRRCPASSAERPSASRITGPAGRVHRQRLAEIAMQHAAQPVPVLQPERIVQAELLLQLRRRHPASRIRRGSHRRRCRAGYARPRRSARTCRTARPRCASRRRSEMSSHDVRPAWRCASRTSASDASSRHRPSCHRRRRS